MGPRCGTGVVGAGFVGDRAGIGKRAVPGHPRPAGGGVAPDPRDRTTHPATDPATDPATRYHGRVDDFGLLAAWAAGDRTAADALFARHFDGVYRFFASKTGHGIEDLVQDTFLAAIAGRERFEQASSFRAFLLGTARNILFHHYRKRGEIVDIGEARLVDLDPSASTMLARRDEERLLLEAVRRISLDHQIALELYEWEGLTAVEVAAVLEVSEAAVRGRIHRAKAAVREQLEQLAASPELLHSTLADLDRWASAVRARLGR